MDERKLREWLVWLANQYEGQTPDSDHEQWRANIRPFIERNLSALRLPDGLDAATVERLLREELNRRVLRRWLAQHGLTAEMQQ